MRRVREALAIILSLEKQAVQARPEYGSSITFAYDSTEFGEAFIVGQVRDMNGLLVEMDKRHEGYIRSRRIMNYQ